MSEGAQPWFLKAGHVPLALKTTVEKELDRLEKADVKSVFTTCHSWRGYSYFSCYGNSILYNERVEIGGYTIQFYHKLE